MQIEKNKTKAKSNAYFRRMVLFRIPTKGADFVPAINCTYCVTYDCFHIDSPRGEGGAC